MKQQAPRHDDPAAEAPGAPAVAPDPDVLRLRTVHRAAAELRRGTPVLLSGGAPLILLAAETAGPRGLAELAALAAEPPVLLLAPMRAAAVLHRPLGQGAAAAALRLSTELLAPEALRGLADPTVEELLPTQPDVAPVPELAASALILAKLAKLLPAVLAAPIAAQGSAGATQLGLLSVPAVDLDAYPVAAAAGLRQIASARVPLENAADSRVIAFRTEGAAIEH